ncbi:MAG TPA: TIGR03118 family protein [Jatrophihabitantaceae bacterium]|jgi:uncharacterized protein (TIGR03118 family)|nr:TIGR03118 family protein [Jatrophihabitantaceae bacterium]
MHGKLIWVGAGVSALVLATLSATATANGATSVKRAASRYVVNKLVADRPNHGAALVDPELVNPWGLSAGPDSPLWVSDNGTDVSTVYTGAMNGGSTSKVLSVGTPGGAPTGQVFNSTSAFKVGGSPATFIFAGEHGDITAWNGGADAIKTAHTKNAVYKGLALVGGRSPRLLAANFHAGRVDVFNGKFALLHTPNAFRGSKLPKHFAPFNVAVIGKRVFVAYAKQDSDRMDDVAGAGHGFIDTFSTHGALLDRFARRGDLNSPWGIAVAPKKFGTFSADLLVGNFGDGRIHVFNPKGGHELATLRRGNGKPIVIDGLWGLLVGNSAAGGPNAVWFSAGPGGEAHGLLGTLTLK